VDNQQTGNGQIALCFALARLRERVLVQ